MPSSPGLAGDEFLVIREGYHMLIYIFFYCSALHQLEWAISGRELIRINFLITWESSPLAEHCVADSISHGSENEEVADYFSLNYEKNLIFFKKKNLSRGLKIIRLYVKVDRQLRKPLTRASRYILIKSFFLAIGRSYLHNLSHTFLNHYEVKLHGQNRFVCYK